MIQKEEQNISYPSGAKLVRKLIIGYSIQARSRSKFSIAFYEA